MSPRRSSSSFSRDQLYFDRVHPVAPIVHQGRYLSWAWRQHGGGSPPSESHACLQFAMWTLAAAASAHLQHMCEALYNSARARLEALDSDLAARSADEYDGRDDDDDDDGNGGGGGTLQQAQAWVLLVHYELRYMQYRRAWLTAGRAFRVIQLARLHEVDRLTMMAGADLAGTPGMPLGAGQVELEERRRTFWLAYCLDRFVNINREWPLSLHEEMVSIFLFYFYVWVNVLCFKRQVIHTRLFHLVLKISC